MKENDDIIRLELSKDDLKKLRWAFIILEDFFEIHEMFFQSNAGLLKKERKELERFVYGVVRKLDEVEEKESE
jgi:hypothetical protein